MKTLIVYVLLSVGSVFAGTTNAQTINWAGIEDQKKHIINTHVGVEYGLIYGAGYAYKLKAYTLPVVAGIEYSFPSGNKAFDDFKTKVGGQIRWLKYRKFQFSTRIQGSFRKYENSLVRLLNFGSEVSGIIGYYRPKWFVAGEFGFDKAIVTHFKHAQLYAEQYAGVVDGWYEPATGGNFFYGLQTGYSLKKLDFYVKGGKIITQDFKTKPMFPVYAQMGINIKL